MALRYFFREKHIIHFMGLPAVLLKKLEVCPSIMTEYNRLCFKNCNLFSVESYLSYLHLSMSTCPSVYNDCCLKFYRNPMPLYTIVLIALTSISLCEYVPMFLCPYVPMFLCLYVLLSLCPYVSMSLCPFVHIFLRP